ncbi:Transmembrane emp24 domain-containing protein 1 [Portunus trituberculatus]|uniref:Transmembrane emp24 domain-containing protein 1 n=1 Tax=Portunus trituberculatus TaxID=210409 RepID=A0A5B7HVQ4_PORTR|nr:Transmembrane emp24 domain-containing protein 1 [Portunus trituberculatus]
MRALRRESLGDMSHPSYGQKNCLPTDLGSGYDAMGRIRAHLTKSRFTQDQLRAYEARDRNLAESNCTKVTTWSIINITVMLVTGLIQVRDVYFPSCVAQGLR